MAFVSFKQECWQRAVFGAVTQIMYFKMSICIIVQFNINKTASRWISVKLFKQNLLKIQNFEL